jgi:hypothetical protein
VTPSLLRPKGGWKIAGVPKSCGMGVTCEHVADVHASLTNPRLRLEVSLVANMHSLSQDVYARSQEANGLRLFRARAIMRDYRCGLERLKNHAHSLFARRRPQRYRTSRRAWRTQPPTKRPLRSALLMPQPPWLTLRTTSPLSVLDTAPSSPACAAAPRSTTRSGEWSWLMYLELARATWKRSPQR